MLLLVVIVADVVATVGVIVIVVAVVVATVGVSVVVLFVVVVGCGCIGLLAWGLRTIQAPPRLNCTLLPTLGDH